MATPVPPPPPRPTGMGPTIRFMAQTRKGLATIYVTIVATVYAAAMTVSYFQGKLTPDAYWDKLNKPGGAIVAAWLIYTLGTSYEDGQEKKRPPIATTPPAPPSEPPPPDVP